MNIPEHTKAFLNMLNRPGAPKFYELGTDAARRSFSKLHEYFGETGASSVTHEDCFIEAEAAHRIPYRKYLPQGHGEAGVTRAIVYFHGGGWCLGGITSHDAVCRRLCQETGLQVYSVDYRLAPEHPFPAALNDARAVIEKLFSSHSTTPGFKVFLAGDSAGGNLAVVAAFELIDAGLSNRVAGNLLVYPAVHADHHSLLCSPYREGFMLDSGSLDWFYSRYLGHERANLAKNWRVSPLVRTFSADFPPTLLITAGLDPLTPACIEFRDRLRAARVAVTHIQFDGVMHGYLTLGRQFPESAETVTRMTEFIAACIKNS